MQKFLCRVLTLTFLITSLMPADVQAQIRRQSVNQKNLSARITRRAVQAQQQNTPANRFEQADKRIRAQHEQAYLKADRATPPSSKTEFDQAAIEEHANPVYRDVSPDTYAQATLAKRFKKPAFFQLRSDFLDKAKKNELSLDEVMEYLDPMNPSLDANNMMLITYAAEMIGNTAGYAKTFPLVDTTEWQEKLPEIEARLLFRLALLGQEAPSYTANKTTPKFSKSRLAIKEKYGKDSVYKTAAIGTLRMTLLKIHQYYQAKGQKDPVEEYQKAVVTNQLRENEPKVLQEMPNERNGWRKPVAKKSPAKSEQEIQKNAAWAVNRFGNLADFATRFANELRAAKNQKPEEGSSEYQRLQILAEYATAYAIDNNPEQLKEIVGIFDEGVERGLNGKVTPGNFHREYSPILNAIFNTIFENTRYSSIDDAKTKQIMNLLADFSNPEKYSLPTRVFSLEAASLLFRPFHMETLQSAQQNLPSFNPINFSKPDESLRKLFAARVVELYCPLNDQSTFGMKDYGLAASEMQALADQLAYIYDGFYDISTITIHMPGQDPHQAPTQCVIHMKNQPNQAKKTQETLEDVFWFTVETAFWTFGGDVLMFLGTAFRLTRGAIIALPAASKAARVANWGEKAVAFNREVRNGAQYANWVYKMKKQQGVVVEFERLITPAKTVKETQVVDGVAKEVEKEIPAVTQWEKVTTTHQLQGKYSAWNPKRWWSGRQRYNDDIIGMRVTQMKPNFDITQGSLEFKPAISGLQSLEDISRTLQQLNTQSGFVLKQRPYWTAILDTRQAELEWSVANGLERSFKNTMDVWVPVSNLAPEEIVTMGPFTFKVKPTPEMIQNSIKWWNVTRWGNPYASIENLGKMPIFISVRNAKVGVTPVEGGIADIPNLVSGFHSTIGDWVSGQWRVQAFKHFFKPMNWQFTNVNNTLLTSGNKWSNLMHDFAVGTKRVFLPDYIPTSAFYQAVKENPMLGVKLAPRLFWRNRFVGTTLFFLTWKGGDELTYPLFKYWLETEQTKDLNAEMAKYGDVFDPKSNKRTEILSQELGLDVTDKRSMQAYAKVSESAPQSGEGTLLNAPFIVAERYIGRMEFLNPAIKTQLAHQAQQITLSRVGLERSKELVDQQEAAVKAARQKDEAAFARAMQQQHDQLLEDFKGVFVQNPALKKQFDQLYQDYISQLPKLQKEEQIQELDSRFVQQRDAILKQANEQIVQQNNSLILSSTAAQAQQMIQYFKENLGMPVVTPAVEQQIRNAYAAYAHKLIKTASISDQQKQKQRLTQLDEELKQELSAIWNKLLADNLLLINELFKQQSESEAY